MAKTLDAFQISIVVIMMQIYMLYLIDANIDNMLADPDIFADFTNLGSWYWRDYGSSRGLSFTQFTPLNLCNTLLLTNTKFLSLQG